MPKRRVKYKLVEHKVDVIPCPRCGSPHDHVSLASTRRRTLPPLTGEFTICAACSQVLVFTDEEGHKRIPTREELQKAMSCDHIRFMVMRCINGGGPLTVQRLCDELSAMENRRKTSVG